MARRRYYEDRWQRFAPSTPLPVEDGIATSKKRGAMAAEWWSQRFVEVLESYGMGARMQRGRRYARAGQVMTLEVEAGLVAAQVQGSRRSPYLVSIRLPDTSAAQWDALDARLAASPAVVSSLLVGEVPAALIDVFEDAGVDLFPRRWLDMRASCNCPDPESPCKHLAAVLYVLADRLDDDPWLLLQWRGRTREEVLELLRGVSHEEAVPKVAPWWPFAPGPIPDELRYADPDVSPARFATDSAKALLLLEPLELEVLGHDVADLLEPAYSALYDVEDPE